MGWKVKRTSPTTRALDVPVGVAWDAKGQGPVIPHHDLVMPDGGRLRYEGSLGIAGQRDDAAYHTLDGFCVGAGIQELSTLGPLLKVACWYRQKDPSWREITMIKRLFFGPTISAMQMVPRDEWFVHGYDGRNTHIFHIWQMPLEWESAFFLEQGGAL
jgi:hypothetical protein